MATGAATVVARVTAAIATAALAVVVVASAAEEPAAVTAAARVATIILYIHMYFSSETQLTTNITIMRGKFVMQFVCHTPPAPFVL